MVPQQPLNPESEVCPCNNREQLHPLTSVRAFAAWWVVFFHFKGLFGTLPTSLQALIGRGELAVDLFFVLSGFVICLNYSDLLLRDRSQVSSFYIKRFARVYPLHLAMLAAYLAFFCALILTGRMDPNDSQYTAPSFVANLLLIQDWAISPRLTWNIPAWSISAEFAAYLCFPFFLSVLRLRRADGRRLAVNAIIVFGALWIVFAPSERLAIDIQRFGALRCLFQFAAGMIAARVYTRFSTKLAPFAPGMIAAAIVMVGATIAFKLPTALVIPIAWMAAITGLACLRGQLRTALSWKPLVYLGEISYATYMCHYLVYELFKLVAVKAGIPTPAWRFAVAFSLILALSSVLYRYIERPGQKWVLKHANPPPRFSLTGSASAPQLQDEEELSY